MQEIKCFFKIFFRFSGKPTITSTPMAQCGINVLINFTLSAYNSLLYRRRINPKYLIAAALQGNMKMRHELFAVGNKFNDLIGQQIGFNRRNAITLNAFYFIQFFYQFKEIFFVGILSCIPAPSGPLPKSPRFTPVNTISFTPFAAKFFCIVHHIFNAIAPAFSSCHRDGAERTIIITAILHFQKSSGSVVDGIGRMKTGYFFNIATADFC